MLVDFSKKHPDSCGECTNPMLCDFFEFTKEERQRCVALGKQLDAECEEWYKKLK